jgi:EAL domain-containing protein (putative c-di-GMP-specific phosphodiesterase class I)
MAHALDLAALAEGVETQAERDAAQDCGCDLGQGYLIARPGPTAALMDYIDAPDHQGEPSP